ncbi:hypothetical protein GH714_003343 [Hevea brasiliensis]|uniref:PABS domain-containing protein n=1 Tax=Hevea brasiliensis TaxID=3981 RepID=A0A6A6K971_HEVBR|nr:hypothetical protein GH714_003343 [Hevea brasiliensis]
MDDIACSNGISSGNGMNGKGHSSPNGYRKSCWYEEEIEENLKFCFALNRSHSVSRHCSVGHKAIWKALVIDGKLQSAEVDEFLYHESLVHPALLHHPNCGLMLLYYDTVLLIFYFSPNTIFIMGGGEGSTAREKLRHRTVKKVVMCDIDEEVVDFCKANLAANREAFCDPRLEIVINDARSELESRKECYDVIIGDLADPIEGGPCYKLYTKSFYEFSVKPKLNQGGEFVTPAGPVGIFSHTEVYSCIYNTLRQVFKYVVPYSAHVPSYADTWGWIMASDSPLVLSADEFDLRIKHKIRGENSSPFDCLIFDLDDTLYSSKLGIAEALRKNIDDFLVEKCGFAENKASSLRVELFKTYGSSLAGLRDLGYDIGADDYHRIHAMKVLKRLGLEDCFDQIICFETMNPNLSKSTRPDEFPVLLKPSMDAMKIALQAADVDPRRTLFLDDNARNVAAGKAMGLQTVLVGKTAKSKEADYVLDNVNKLAQVIPEIWVTGKDNNGDQSINRTRSELDSILATTPVGA